MTLKISRRDKLPKMLHCIQNTEYLLFSRTNILWLMGMIFSLVDLCKNQCKLQGQEGQLI